MPLDNEREPRVKPDSPVGLPTDRKELLKTSLDLIEQCRTSAGIRAAYCRQLYAMVETGRQDGSRSLLNMLFNYLDKLASHLFSPIELKFLLDFENDYPKEILARGHKAAKLITRDWERSNTDMKFGQGVFEALRYGAAILKQWVQEEGPDKLPVYYSSLVMPWQFGVYREDINDLNKQPALCETTLLSLPEVWRRIWHMPDAEKLFSRIKTHAQRGAAGDEYSSFFHQILSTSTLNTTGSGLTRPAPGGIVQLNNDPNYAIMGPEIAVDLIRMHELWVWNGQHRHTIQVIEPDILIAPGPFFKISNLLVSGDHDSDLHPYTLIQPNTTHGYLWGRSEIVDLIEPQGWLSTTGDDIRRLFGLQVDKFLALIGFDGINDEVYAEMRSGGFLNMPQNSSVNDITPKFPPEAIPLIKMISEFMEKISGFDNLLSGRGEPGVRSGGHADQLMKLASPRLRDRALLVERQCAAAADLRLSIMEAKDPRNYWTDGTSVEKMAETKFLLAELPEDRRVSVDSHSSSPIFADDHQNLISFGVKSHLVGPESAIKLLPFPDKDNLILELRDREAKEQAMMNQLLARDPEALVKILSHKGGKK